MALVAVLPSLPTSAAVWYDGVHPVSYYVERNTEPVVSVAAQMFSSDMKAVTGKAALRSGERSRAVIEVIEMDKASRSVSRRLRASGVPVDALKTKIDGFYIGVHAGKIVVAGRNGRGTAYGLLELSRMAGVSPWIWWGDVTPAPKDRLTIDDTFSTLQGASVEYRGIFLNDEDWSLRPWSRAHFEESAAGTMGPKTYKKIFQLLLRLRANALWPAMHPGTPAFFSVPGNKAMADSCGIVIGSSHCEPLLRNNVGEWNVAKRGRFNYLTNRQAVQDYWAERLREVRGSAGGNMFTIGMRGIHDGSMEGVKTMPEKFDALQQVINDQQRLLQRYVGDPSRQMQVFIPYKEVLQIYERGLKVPDYVTLMWCDDNYGYLTRLSSAEEQHRRGGAGVYYHLSYWGRPHDYLWLTTTQPGLIYQEMQTAYDHQARKLWIVNVHDPKVAGYDLELFLDMAWDIHCVKGDSLEAHYQAWLCRQFGSEAGARLFPAMKDYYRLCGERHPEFMGWSQTELDKKLYDRGLSQQRNTAFTDAFGGELDRYLDRYAAVAATVKAVEKLIPDRLKDAFFAAIEYPVLAAEAHARKLLWAQRARAWAAGSESGNENWARVIRACAESQAAYQEIRSLTAYYNNTLAGGKWRCSMSMCPRDLPVFAAPSLPTLLTDAEVKAGLVGADSVEHPARNEHPLKVDGVVARNACDYDHASAGTRMVQMLGHSMRAVVLPQDGSLTYVFSTTRDGDSELTVALIPTQPHDDGDLRFSVSVDGAPPTLFSLKEPFRSERWKENVLRGQTLRRLALPDMKAGRHTLVIKALDAPVVVDQWMWQPLPVRSAYLLPVAEE